MSTAHGSMGAIACATEYVLPSIMIPVVPQVSVPPDAVCCAQVEEGGIPNEHGTWQYGRNGWCDGQNVRPWIVEVTKDLKFTHSNAENVVEYLGLFEGRDPDPEATPGYIMMQSSLVLEGSFDKSKGSQAVS